MKKIKDRFLLGAIAGLGGNLVKIAVERAAIRLFGFNETGAKKAADIFLKKKDVPTLPGKALGLVADNMIAASHYLRLLADADGRRPLHLERGRPGRGRMDRPLRGRLAPGGNQHLSLNPEKRVDYFPVVSRLRGG